MSGTPLHPAHAGAAHPGSASTHDNADSVVVVLWPDAEVMSNGHEARSAYVERFWLGLLGPSTTWLWRRLVRGLDECPGGYRIQLADTARALGLGAGTGRNSMIVRSLDRMVQFGAAHRDGDVVEVRTHLPELSARQLRRLPPAVQQAHRRWLDDQLNPPVDLHRPMPIPTTPPTRATWQHRSPSRPAG